MTYRIRVKNNNSKRRKRVPLDLEQVYSNISSWRTGLIFMVYVEQEACDVAKYDD